MTMFYLTYVPVMVWFAGVIVVMGVLIHRYTLRESRDTPNPYKNETFAIPRGVIRGVLTLSLLFIVILLEVLNLAIEAFPFETVSEQLLVAFQMMLAFYFGSKVLHHVTNADKQKSKDVADSMAAGQQQQPQKETGFVRPGAVG